MPIDLQLILRVLRLILHVLEMLPADFDHQPISTTARELVETILPSSKTGGTSNA